jgi:glutamate-1-semialdehyde 2,1-aminomutase
MFTWFFTEGPVFDCESAQHSDTARFSRFFPAMFDRGVYLPPSQFEAALVSAAHTEENIRTYVRRRRTPLPCQPSFIDKLQ